MVQGWYCALRGLNPQDVTFYSVLPVLRTRCRRLPERGAGRSERARRPYNRPECGAGSGTRVGVQLTIDTQTDACEQATAAVQAAYGRGLQV
ncbi:hypothetical protein OHV08_03715 [Streptomyces canus]|uniref:hypothetical protein n=1 Tax=Streptomyces canus TaxID=58343 RepID=UPI00324DE37A